ncbi:solute carrier family 2, facilitated glucose transporter member 5-like [Rhineura floridana]|uniref:solute carrier family 2, facilitated glucose transporter member 5-like n=1 Tax=Rhineura floridana TaxID=261503 RepID=UPI002AC8680D|nr:solute carrier family 2, facilitated glucose transporter member 5-like [Rhineura floridana]
MTTIQKSTDTSASVVEKPAAKKLLTDTLFRTVVVSAMGSMQHGYNLWVVYSPTLLMKDFTHEDNQYMLFMLEITVSLFPLGGLIGALAVGSMVDTYGRKGALLINSFCSMVSSMFMICSTVIHAYLFSMFSRFLVGITMGIFSGVVPLYLAEISPVNLRGAIGMLPHLFLTLGVLLAQILAFQELLGNKEDWPILMSFSGILALFQTIVIPAFPESPRYLLIQKNDEEKAREALKKLRRQDDVEHEIKEICQENLSEKSDKGMNALKLLCYPGLRWQVISIIILMSGQQLSGVNAVYFYTDRIYLSTVIDKDNTRFIAVGSTIAILIFVLIGMYLVDSMGRKRLLLFGFGICTFFCIVLTMTLELQATISWMSYINAVFINVFLLGHASGPSSLPNLITAEMFLQSTRSSAFVVAGCVHWFLNFFTVTTFLHLQQYIGFYSFLICCPICAATFVYIFKMIPETKGKTFVEIRKVVPVYVGKRALAKRRRRGR